MEYIDLKFNCFSELIVILMLLIKPLIQFPVACHSCGKRMRRSSLRRHYYDVHLPPQQLPCDFCHKTFKSANSLTTHLITIHKKFKCDRNMIRSRLGSVNC